MLREAVEREVMQDTSSLSLSSNGLVHARQISVPPLARVQFLLCHWNDHAHYLIWLPGQHSNTALAFFASIVLTKAIFLGPLPPFDYSLWILCYQVFVGGNEMGRGGYQSSLYCSR